MVGVLLVFWALGTERTWVSVAFYFFSALAGSLLISQFWTLANDLFDARQAKRVFGFIGGGASLGGIVGSKLASLYSVRLGTNNLILVGGAMLLACFFVVLGATRDQKVAPTSKGKSEKGRLKCANMLSNRRNFGSK
jgi:AAA family ATP:ADP antiporter